MAAYSTSRIRLKSKRMEWRVLVLASWCCRALSLLSSSSHRLRSGSTAIPKLAKLWPTAMAVWGVAPSCMKLSCGLAAKRSNGATMGSESPGYNSNGHLSSQHADCLVPGVVIESWHHLTIYFWAKRTDLKIHSCVYDVLKTARCVLSMQTCLIRVSIPSFSF